MSYKMCLQDLRKARDTVAAVELSLPETEILDRYEKLYTGYVNDVLREMCLTDLVSIPHVQRLAIAR